MVTFTINKHSYDPYTPPAEDTNLENTSVNEQHGWKIGELCLVKTFGRNPRYVLAYIVGFWGPKNAYLCRVRFADNSVPDVEINVMVGALRKPSEQN
jgi:hypothetical protein